MTDAMLEALRKLSGEPMLLAKGQMVPVGSISGYTARALRKRGYVSFKGFDPTMVVITFTGLEVLKVQQN